MSRAERRGLAGKYRRIDVGPMVCDVMVWHAAGTLPVPCGATLGATFVVERGEAAPNVTFVHNPDGSHRPVLSGDSAAAIAARTGKVIGTAKGQL